MSQFSLKTIVNRDDLERLIFEDQYLTSARSTGIYEFSSAQLTICITGRVSTLVRAARKKKLGSGKPPSLRTSLKNAHSPSRPVYALLGSLKLSDATASNH
jgi:hypothetical protein